MRLPFSLPKGFLSVNIYFLFAIFGCFSFFSRLLDHSVECRRVYPQGLRGCIQAGRSP